jgi:hypothetical protein
VERLSLQVLLLYRHIDELRVAGTFVSGSQHQAVDLDQLLDFQIA